MTIPASVHTAMSDAIEAGDTRTVSSLAQQYPQLVDHPHWTPPPLHCVVLWNQPRVAEILLEYGAALERKDADRQTTPLRYAILYGKIDMVRLLLSRGANPGRISDGGTSALELAKHAAAGAFEDYDDLPARTHYSEIVTVLERWESE